MKKKELLTPAFMKVKMPSITVTGKYDWKEQRGIVCKAGTYGTTNGPTNMPYGTASDRNIDSWND